MVEGEDSDVAKERWIMNQDAETLSSKYIMKIKDLTRAFNSGIFKREEKIAVKRISVGIKKGEVGTRLVKGRFENPICNIPFSKGQVKCFRDLLFMIKSFG